MDTIQAIIDSNVSDTIKSRILVTVVKEDESLMKIVISMLSKLSDEKLLAIFFTDYEYLSVHKRKNIITPNSASEWTHDELRYFMIEFRDTQDIDSFCSGAHLTDRAQKFLSANIDLTRQNMFGLTQRSAKLANTEFKEDALFAINTPSNESSIDDMMKTFLSDILSADRFLVKTRYDMQLTIASKKRKATADVIVVLFPQLYIGIVVIEDKSYESENNWENAEAQTVAEAIAVMQQKSWPKDAPVFAMRVLETCVTLYKLSFDTQFLSDIERGARRDIPYIIDKFAPDTIATGQRPGWDLLEPSSREILVRTICNISVNIEKTHEP